MFSNPAENFFAKVNFKTIFQFFGSDALVPMSDKYGTLLFLCMKAKTINFLETVFMV